MHCGSIFHISKKQYNTAKRTNNHNRNKYCCIDCRTHAKHPIQNKICEFCNKQFKTTDSHKRFCCITCARSFSSSFGHSEKSNNKRIESLKAYHSNKCNNPKRIHKNRIYNETKRIKFIIEQVKELYNQYNISEMTDIINQNCKTTIKTIKNILNKYQLVPKVKFLSLNNKLKIKISRNVLNIKNRSITEDDFIKAFEILKNDYYNLNLTPSQINDKYNLKIKQPTSSLSVLGLKLGNYKRQYKHIKNANYNQYRSMCQFRFNKNVYPLVEGYELLKKYGIWNKSNPNGVARDHKLSIKYGYDHNINPSIISHPANCEFISLRENSSKGSECSITLDQLLQRIEQWENTKTF